jgi:hypothetical protein
MQQMVGGSGPDHPFGASAFLCSRPDEESHEIALFSNPTLAMSRSTSAGWHPSNLPCVRSRAICSASPLPRQSRLQFEIVEFGRGNGYFDVGGRSLGMRHLPSHSTVPHQPTSVITNHDETRTVLNKFALKAIPTKRKLEFRQLKRSH